MCQQNLPNLVQSFIAKYCGLLSFALLIFCTSGVTQAESTTSNWSHWRGPLGNGLTDSTGSPITWSPTENILWQTTLPGPSSATPTLSGNRLFTTSLLDEEYQLDAYSTFDGTHAWTRTITTIDRKKNRAGVMHSAPSLVSDKDCVVVTTDQGECSCYRINGQPRWKIDLTELLNPLQLRSSYSSTPFLHEGNLYLQWIHGDGDPATHESMVCCIDARTGTIVWTTERFTGARKACEQSYASPILIDSNNQEVIVSYGADYAVAHRLEDGHEVWRIGGLNPMSNYRSSSPFVASPIASEGILILPAAKNGVVVALDLTGKRANEEGSINRSRSGLIGWGPQKWKNLSGKPKRLWRLSGGAPGTASPLLHKELLYLCSENGELTCHNALTSEVIYRERLPRDYYHASPVMAEGKIYFTSYSGKVIVVDAGRSFEILAENQLPGPIVSSPIIDQGVIYLRSYKTLYAIGSKKTQTAVELSSTAR